MTFDEWIKYTPQLQPHEIRLCKSAWQASRRVAMKDAAELCENYSILWSNLRPEQSKSIAAFFSRNILAIDDKVEEKEHD